MSAVFNHAIRYEWTHRNPITKVRASSKRLREPDVLTPAEFAALVDELPLRVKAMVILAGSTGLRRSELVALTWRDVDPLLMQVNVIRSCVRGRFGDTKTRRVESPFRCKESLYNGETISSLSMSADLALLHHSIFRSGGRRTALRSRGETAAFVATASAAVDPQTLETGSDSQTSPRIAG